MALSDILSRIAVRREKLGLSEGAVSLQAGLSRDGIRNWRRRVEAGEDAAGATINALAGVARALRVSETWLIHGIGEGPGETGIPAVGIVGAGARVPLSDTDEAQGGMFHVAAPVQLLRRGPVSQFAAVVVEGDSMVPVYEPGEILFYSRATHEGILDEDIGRACIVADQDGHAWVKQVKRGDQPGLYHLLSINPSGDNMHNIPIKWAARVIMALPGDMVERI